MKIGIISDTHGKLHPKVFERFDGVDHILHAGDIGDEQILDELEAIAPVTAVAGNIDGFHCGAAREEARIQLGGLRFYLTHILDRPQNPRLEVRQALEREAADVIIFGHSHLPHNEKRGDLWFFNPASAGPRRFDYPTSVGFFQKDSAGQWHAWHSALDSRSEKALASSEHMNRLSKGASAFF